VKLCRVMVGFIFVVGLLGGCSSGDAATVGLAQEGTHRVMTAEDMAMELSNVPKGWPSDIPIPPGGRLEAWTHPFENQINASWRVEQVDTASTDFFFDNLLINSSSLYNQVLQQGEWSESDYLATKESSQGKYVAKDRTLTFVATPTSDGAVSFYVEFIISP